MDDQRNVTSAPIAVPPVSRTGITIPKAVTSMTSIPTREDYKAVVDANMEKKRRKERSGFLDPPIDDEERRRSFMVSGGAVDRRRGRQTRPSTAFNSGPPKLKIKIGNSIIGPDPTNLQQDDNRIRPPKKRLSNIPSKPSMEDLKRESMKYRRLVMADFHSEEQPKVKSKKDKNGKRKKRQNKKDCRVQLLEDSGVAPPKLIIRLGKSNKTINDEQETKTEESSCNDNTRVEPPPTSSQSAEPNKEETIYPPDIEINEKQPTDPDAGSTTIGNVRSAKVTPIRLKLTRCQEGYELKSPAASSANKETKDDHHKEPGTSLDITESKSEIMEKSSKEDIPLLTENVTHNTSGCPPAPLPQGCQVR